MSYPQVNKLKKDLLPTVSTYLFDHGFNHNTSKEWSMILCPFHNDIKPSLSINLNIGCFKCFACGVKGGDIISFHMEYKKLNFINACKDLGVWEKSK